MVGMVGLGPRPQPGGPLRGGLPCTVNDGARALKQGS